MKLEGWLKHYPLRELLEMTVYSSVTGVLNIIDTQPFGQIYFRDGQLYHVISGELTGMDAFASLFEAEEARFSFVSEVTIEAESIWGDPLELAEQAERLAGRWQRLRPLIPHLKLVPVALRSSDEARTHVSPDFWPYFAAIDGVQTLAAIATALQCDRLELCEAIVQMHADQLIELRATGQVAGSSAIAKPPQPMSPKGGFFDRLMAGLPQPTRPTRATENPAAPADGAARKDTAPPDITEEAILRLLRS